LVTEGPAFALMEQKAPPTRILLVEDLESLRIASSEEGKPRARQTHGANAHVLFLSDQSVIRDSGLTTA